MRVILRWFRTAAALLVLAGPTVGCNSTGPEGPSIDGTWIGSVPELQLEITLLLTSPIIDGIIGSAALTSPEIGSVQGDVTGTTGGDDVDFTIGIEGAIVAGSVVFDGEFLGDDTLSGTLDSGLLGGVWPVTFQKAAS